MTDAGPLPAGRGGTSSYTIGAVVVLSKRRVGRRCLTLTAICGFAVFSVLCGLSLSLGSLVTFRLGQGMLGAFLIPLSQPNLFDAFPREKRGQTAAGLILTAADTFMPGALTRDADFWQLP